MLSKIKDYSIGETRIQIYDDYCKDQTDKEAAEIISQVSVIVRRSQEVQNAGTA